MCALPIVAHTSYIGDKHMVNSLIEKNVGSPEGIHPLLELQLRSAMIRPGLAVIIRHRHTDGSPIAKGDTRRLNIGPALCIEHPPLLFFSVIDYYRIGSAIIDWIAEKGGWGLVYLLRAPSCLQ